LERLGGQCLLLLQLLLPLLLVLLLHTQGAGDLRDWRGYGESVNDFDNAPLTYPISHVTSTLFVVTTIITTTSTTTTTTTTTTATSTTTTTTIIWCTSEALELFLEKRRKRRGSWVLT
jgi:hypothetical protein